MSQKLDKKTFLAHVFVGNINTAVWGILDNRNICNSWEAPHLNGKLGLKKDFITKWSSFTLWHKREWHNSLLSDWTFLSDCKDLTAEMKRSLSSQHASLPQQCSELSHLHWDARSQEKVICSNLTTDLFSEAMLNLYFLKNVFKVTLHVYHHTKTCQTIKRHNSEYVTIISLMLWVRFTPFELKVSV